MGHVDDILESLESLGEELKKNSPLLASNHLLNKGAGGLLNKEMRETLHSVVAKGISISKQSQPDIAPTIVVLSRRVRDPNHDDWTKRKRLATILRPQGITI